LLLEDEAAAAERQKQIEQPDNQADPMASSTNHAYGDDEAPQTPEKEIARMKVLASLLVTVD
jgi:hypothetical protein